MCQKQGLIDHVSLDLIPCFFILFVAEIDPYFFFKFKFFVITSTAVKMTLTTKGTSNSYATALRWQIFMTRPQKRPKIYQPVVKASYHTISRHSLVIYSLGGGHTQTHAHTHAHACISTARSQALAWLKNETLQTHLQMMFRVQK